MASKINAAQKLMRPAFGNAIISAWLVPLKPTFWKISPNDGDNFLRNETRKAYITKYHTETEVCRNAPSTLCA
jgi:hypothetical protein